MADFDEMSRSCENDKVEISAYERINVISFMTETFHNNEAIIRVSTYKLNKLLIITPIPT